MLTGGTYEVDAGSTLQLPNNSPIITDDADIILSGAGSMIQDLERRRRAVARLHVANDRFDRAAASSGKSKPRNRSRIHQRRPGRAGRRDACGHGARIVADGRCRKQALWLRRRGCGDLHKFGHDRGLGRGRSISRRGYLGLDQTRSRALPRWSSTRGCRAPRRAATRISTWSPAGARSISWPPRASTARFPTSRRTTGSSSGLLGLFRHLAHRGRDHADTRKRLDQTWI